MPTPPLQTTRDAVHNSPLRRVKTKRVFICDDDLEYAAELASALVEEGFEAKTLRDGKSPVEIFELFRPDILLLDIFMPPPDGFEIVNHISQDTRQKPLSVVLVSGADATLLDVVSSFCKARGIKPAGILKKPVRLGAIIDLCEDHFRKHPQSGAQAGDPQG
jgi:DNA-binding response OmpR family regulator